MVQDNLASAGEPSLHQHERAVRIDGQCFRFFLDVFALDIFAANLHGHLH
jgi:hypothetical protein